MRILFLAAYSELAAASRIKVYQFLPLLEKKGIKCKVICFTPSFVFKIRQASVSNKKLLLVYYFLLYLIRPFKTILAILLAPRFDIVYIQEPIIPFGLEKLLKIVNKNIVFLFTDAVFLGPQKTDKFLERARKKVLSKYWERLSKVAVYCLVENDYNKEVVLKLCPNVEKIAGPMDTDKYLIKEYKKHSGPVIIGWVGTVFTSKYLYEIKSALQNLAKKYDIILRVMEATKNFNIEGVVCENKIWKKETELDEVSSFDIGIMPLPYDEWTMGKGGFKLLQYMSLGVSAVASPVGINKEIVSDGVNGFLAKNSEEWEEKLTKLIEDENLRRKIGERARATIEERYSLQKAIEKLLKIFNQISK